MVSELYLWGGNQSLNFIENNYNESLLIMIVFENRNSLKRKNIKILKLKQKKKNNNCVQ